MARFSAATTSVLFAKCLTVSKEIGQTLARALDLPPGELSVESRPPGEVADVLLQFPGASLVLCFEIKGSGAALVFSSQGNALPDWCRHPGVSEASRLNLLARELAPLLFPPEFEAVGLQASWLDDTSLALQHAEPAEELGRIALTLSGGEQTCLATLVWPLAAPQNAFQADAPVPPAEIPVPTAPTKSEQPATREAPANSAASSPGASTQRDVASTQRDAASTQRDAASTQRDAATYRGLEDGLRMLPAYMQSLLRIKVPVVVTLAETKQTLDRVLQLGPGSIIQFNKACDEPLTLEVGRTQLARGEAVKVGDKFGLWVTAIVLPEERFGPAQCVTLKQS